MSVGIGGAVFLALAIGWQSSREIDTATIVVPDGSNPLLTVAIFYRIKNFLLAQGKEPSAQATYSSFTRKLYWPFPGFNIYLEPKRQWISGKVDNVEFNGLSAIKFVPKVSGTVHYIENNYYPRVVLEESGKELRIFEHVSRTDPQLLVPQATEYFQVALSEIDRLASHGEPGGPPAAPKH